MSFLEDFANVVLQGLSKVAEEGRKQQAEAQRKYAPQIREREAKLRNAEAHLSSMSQEQRQRVIAAREHLEEAKSKLYCNIPTIKRESTNSLNSLDEIVEELDRHWQCIGPLEKANLSLYNHDIGLYRHVINGKTMYLGRAIEKNNGGFRKRLSDYIRPNDSARKHTSGQIINSHADEIVTYILPINRMILLYNLNYDDVTLTKILEPLFIQKYGVDNDLWNKIYN